MNWLHIHCEDEDLVAPTDELFIKEFIDLTHLLHHPDDLALYQLKFRTVDGQVLYISSTDVYGDKLKEILAHFPAQEVTRPNLKDLKLFLGKEVSLE